MTRRVLVPHRAITYQPDGLTGATAASRYVGATASGAPASGTFAVGDFVIAQNGKIWICTVAGSPGTWTDVAAGGLTAATSVTSETTYGIAAAVGTSTNYARQDHTHGTPSTPATSVAGRTGAVTLTAADIGAGTFPGANSFSGLQTFNAGLTVPVGQPMTTGTRSILTGTRATTTNASDTVNLGTFSSTGGAMEIRIHAHLVAGAAGATASVTKVYELVVGSTMGTLNTWYLCYPSDASANAASTNDFALEVERTAAGTFVFRFRQKSIAAAGVITWTAETLGDTAVTFTASTTVTAAPAAVSTMHPSNPHVEAAGQVGIGTEAPAVMLDVAGAINSTSAVTGTTLAASGLTGATAVSRYGGATASGAPASGTWAAGDFTVDQTGAFYICTAAGTPGTWVKVGGGMKLLAGALYDPATAVTKGIAAASAMTALDTTNLRLSFTAPASGRVMVRQAGVISGTTATPAILIGTLDGATVRGRVSVGPALIGAPGANNQFPFEVTYLVDGLTPGTVYNFDAAYGVELVGSGAGAGIKYGGPNDTTTVNAWGGYAFEIYDVG